MIGFLVDAVIVIIISMFIVSGFKSGMIKSFLFFLNSVLSWIFSVYVSKFISYFIYNKFIRPSIIKEVDMLIRNKNLKEHIIFNKLPKIIVNSMPNYGITLDKIAHIINNVSKEILPNEISKIFMPMITEFLTFFITGILFIILILLGKFFIHLILKLFKLKVVSYSDKIIGGVFGALKGYTIILIFVCILKILMPFSILQENNKFIFKTISSTVILKTIYNNNPVYNVFKRL